MLRKVNANLQLVPKPALASSHKKMSNRKGKRLRVTVRILTVKTTEWFSIREPAYLKI